MISFVVLESVDRRVIECGEQREYNRKIVHTLWLGTDMHDKDRRIEVSQHGSRDPPGSMTTDEWFLYARDDSKVH